VSQGGPPPPPGSEGRDNFWIGLLASGILSCLPILLGFFMSVFWDLLEELWLVVLVVGIPLYFLGKRKTAFGVGCGLLLMILVGYTVRQVYG